MKLIKAIRLHWKLRIRQEYLFFKVCQHSQNLLEGISPFHAEFCSINKAAKKISDKIPDIYFILSDLFGGAHRLKKQCKEYIKKKEDVDNPIKCPICNSSDNNSIPTYKKTNGPIVPGKRITYGYRFIKNYCNDCKYTWEGEKIN